ncbi:TIM barrel protein [Snuella sedimenti]|uniref:TIM barrel protein n=1 Tax=Snuella sedimenti TaxID=2798802 RepID=A0A8J7IHE8_9FLAO|nr:TIM barrel protein [Snuella sedimenti]MBJ6368373.1 TIM barrel protein [Snuella sedimenti]
MNKLKPSVCIDAVFEGKSFEEACKSVRQSEITAIEFWGWWDKDLDALVKAQLENNLKISACCTKFISLVDANLRDQYLKGLKESIATAKKLKTDILISQVGDFIIDVPRATQFKSLVDGLKAAAPFLEEAGITLVIEPLNELIDHKGYFLVNSDEAFKIIEAVNSPNIKVVFDIYHQQISEGQLIKNIVSNIDKIGHFHAAGNPGRNELQRGEINYPEVFKAIIKTGFSGYVGLEYWPLEKTPEKALTEVASWLD